MTKQWIISYTFHVHFCDGNGHIVSENTEGKAVQLINQHPASYIVQMKKDYKMFRKDRVPQTVIMELISVESVIEVPDGEFWEEDIKAFN